MGTAGVYHIQISVSDLDRSLAFYTGLMGMEELFRAGRAAFLRTPGARELLTLQPVEGPVNPKAGGMDRFGFYVPPEDHDTAVAKAASPELRSWRQGASPKGYPTLTSRIRTVTR